MASADMTRFLVTKKMHSFQTVFVISGEDGAGAHGGTAEALLGRAAQGPQGPRAASHQDDALHLRLLSRHLPPRSHRQIGKGPRDHERARGTNQLLPIG